MARPRAARRRSTSGHAPVRCTGPSAASAPLDSTSRANQKNPYGASVSVYGASPIGSEAVLAEHLDRHRTAEAAQVELDVLGEAGQVGDAQQRLLVGSLGVGQRTNASTWWLSGSRKSIVPRPSTRWRLRRAVNWRIHDSGDAGLAACVSTLTLS